MSYGYSGQGNPGDGPSTSSYAQPLSTVCPRCFDEVVAGEYAPEWLTEDHLLRAHLEGECEYGHEGTDPRQAREEAKSRTRERVPK